MTYEAIYYDDMRERLFLSYVGLERFWTQIAIAFLVAVVRIGIHVNGRHDEDVAWLLRSADILPTCWGDRP